MIRTVVDQVEPLLVAQAEQSPAADVAIGDPAAVLVAAGIVDRHDVRVVEPRRRAGLAKETLLHPLAGLGQLQHLQRNVAVEPGIVRLVNLSRPAVTQQFAKLEPAERPERSLDPRLGPELRTPGDRERAVRDQVGRSGRSTPSPVRSAGCRSSPRRTDTSPALVRVPVHPGRISTLCKQSPQTMRMGAFMVQNSLRRDVAQDASMDDCTLPRMLIVWGSSPYNVECFPTDGLQKPLELGNAPKCARIGSAKVA